MVLDVALPFGKTRVRSPAGQSGFHAFNVSITIGAMGMLRRLVRLLVLPKSLNRSARSQTTISFMSRST